MKKEEPRYETASTIYQRLYDMEIDFPKIRNKIIPLQTELISNNLFKKSEIRNLINVQQYSLHVFFPNLDHPGDAFCHDFQFQPIWSRRGGVNQFDYIECY